MICCQYTTHNNRTAYTQFSITDEFVNSYRLSYCCFLRFVILPQLFHGNTSIHLNSLFYCCVNYFFSSFLVFFFSYNALVVVVIIIVVVFNVNSLNGLSITSFFVFLDKYFKNISLILILLFCVYATRCFFFNDSKETNQNKMQCFVTAPSV